MKGWNTSKEQTRGTKQAKAEIETLIESGQCISCRKVRPGQIAIAAKKVIIIITLLSTTLLLRRINSNMGKLRELFRQLRLQAKIDLLKVFLKEWCSLQVSKKIQKKCWNRILKKEWEVIRIVWRNSYSKKQKIEAGFRNLRISLKKTFSREDKITLNNHLFSQKLIYVVTCPSTTKAAVKKIYPWIQNFGNFQTNF